MKAGKLQSNRSVQGIASLVFSVGAAAVLAAGCCGSSSNTCPLRQAGYATASQPARNEAVAVRDKDDATPAKTISDWMQLQRSDLP